MGGIPMRRVLLATLAICLPGRETGQVAPPLPDLAAMAAHEGRSRPALGPRGTPWVAPPVGYALPGPGHYYAPWPRYWEPWPASALGSGAALVKWHRGRR
ncbi:hypothetical protein ACFQU2_31090 [Siccirubricoccus deserti]